jgi:uncharacterized protein
MVVRPAWIHAFMTHHSHQNNTAQPQELTLKMTPPDLHHPLFRELPEYRETIHQLKTSSAHFRRLFDEYHVVDREVVRIEEEIEPASDERTEQLKRQRLRLKDELHDMLKKAASA